MEENVQNTGGPAPEDNGSAVDESLLSPDASAEGAAAEQQGADSPAPEAGEKKEEGEAPLLNPEEGDAKKEENPDVGAPEDYSDFTLPEGFTLDDSVKEEVCGMFKGMNLSQAGAQKLIDAYAKRIVAQKESELEALNTRRMAWRKEVRQRPTYEAERALAQKGMREVVNTPEEKALFTNSWMSDHPAVFGMFVKIGRLLGEDAPMPNGGKDADSGDSAVARFPIKL
jgi:hypothetical protein